MRDVQLEKAAPPGVPPASLQPSVAHRVSQRLRAAAADILHALLPSDCRLCGAPVLSARVVRLCDRCVLDAVPEREPGPVCDRCGVSMGLESARFSAGMGITACMLCRLAPPEFAGAVSAADYTAQMRELLHQLKYDNVRGMAQSILGERLAAAIATLPLRETDVLVIPVPLFAARRRERGYNQAELLATAAMARLGRMKAGTKLRLAPQLLERVKDTRAMHALQPHLRRASLSGAFRARNKRELAGRTVLLVDDIMTTGATARECARTLRAAGAAQVWVATVARAQPESHTSANSTARWTQPAVAAGAAQLISPRLDRQHGFSQ